MPATKQFTIEKPIFQGAQNVRAWCDVDGCTWDFFGPRFACHGAWEEHYRMNHSQDVGAVLLNQNARESLWLPVAAKEAGANG